MPPLSHIETMESVSDSNHYSFSMEPKAHAPLHLSSRKRVTFADSVSVEETIHFTEFSKEEIESAWYSRLELRSIKDESKRLANLDRETNTDVCFRGLEARTPFGARTKRENRLNARSAVFFEQDMQECDGYSDPDTIADIYFECAEQCQVDAQMLAVHDEKEAREIHQSSKISDIPSQFNGLMVTEVAIGSAAA